MNEKDIISIITEAGAQDSQAIIDTLEDGATLLQLGITDEDQEAVEAAHAMVEELL